MRSRVRRVACLYSNGDDNPETSCESGRIYSVKRAAIYAGHLLEVDQNGTLRPRALWDSLVYELADDSLVCCTSEDI